MDFQSVIRLLAVLTLASNVGIVLYFLSFFSKSGLLSKKIKTIRQYFARNAVRFSFIVSLVATLGSLFLSEVAGFAPCILCWYQRIFMYPLTLILGVSLFKKTKDVWQYVIPVALVGLALAGYHYVLQIYPDSLVPCTTIGFAVSCTERFFTYFGYITIPWMSLSAFVLIMIGMFIEKKESKRDK